MNIKGLTNEEITITVSEFARLLALAADRDKKIEELKLTQAKVVRMRAQLTAFHRICTRLKSSGAGASVEPQKNETNADTNVDAVLLTTETEGRVSGGERADKINN